MAVEKHITRAVAKMAQKVGLDFELDFGSNCPCYHIKKTTGFDKDYVVPYHVHLQYPDREKYLFAPTQSFFQRWLREVHNIHIGIDFDSHGWGFFITEMDNPKADINWSNDNYETYEGALEGGFKIALRDYVK
jgi:GDP-D-mannose dehydratase